MLPGMELMACPAMAVSPDVMQHVVRVESSFNPYAIGVVGGRLARQPRNLGEAVATARMLEARGYNFSLGLAQVNRYNLARYGLSSYEKAFQACPNLQAGSRILAECRSRSGGDWGKAFSCYYSGNFVTGYRHGYVQKVFASMQAGAGSTGGAPDRFPGAIPLAAGSAPPAPRRRVATPARATASTPAAALSWSRRIVVTTPPAAPGASAPPAITATASTPSAGQPASMQPTAQRADTVAVLDAAGGPPALVPTGPAPAASAPPSPRIEAAPSDAAFVF